MRNFASATSIHELYTVRHLQSNLQTCKEKFGVKDFERTVFPHIVSAPLCTVTFGFPISKKNSFRGKYMRKYGILNQNDFIIFLPFLSAKENLSPYQRANSVRVSRNRGCNESFRAAVDRSYENDFPEVNLFCFVF